MQWMVPFSTGFGSLSGVELFLCAGGALGEWPFRAARAPCGSKRGKVSRLVDVEVSDVRIKKYYDQLEKG